MEINDLLRRTVLELAEYPWTKRVGWPALLGLTVLLWVVIRFGLPA